MFLFWGEELICFYNDAYRPSLGNEGKHPHALGKPGEEVWPEIWHIIKPLIDQVLNGGGATWSEDQLIPIFRNNRMEDVYWTFSYSPVAGEDGKPSGVFVTCVETTDKVQSLKEVKESEERFRTLAESSDVLIEVGDTSSNATYFNKSWFLLTGRPMEDLLQFGWVDLLHPIDRDRYVNIYLSAFEKRIPFTGEFRVLTKDGEYRWLLAKGVPRFQTDGTFAGYISSCIDITEQIAAHSIIEESEKRFRTLADDSPIFVFIIDPDPTAPVYYWNKTWLDYTGKTFEEAKGRAWNDVIHPEDIQTVMDHYSPAFDKRETYIIPSVRVLRHDGEYRWHTFKGNPRFLSNGEFNGYIGTGFDIHDRKMAEDALAESAEQFSTLADNISQFAWMADEKGWIYWYNRRWYEYTGTTLEEMQGWGWQKVHHPDHVDRVIKKIQQSWDTGEIWEDTFPLRSKDGEYRWYLSRAIPIRDDEGKVIRWFGTNTDITENKNAEDAIKKSEKGFRQLADLMPSKVSVFELPGGLNYFNKSWLDFSGLDAKEIKSYNWDNSIHPDDLPAMNDLVSYSHNHGVPLEMELRIKDKNGNYQWQICRSSPLQDEKGEIKSWIYVTTDIQKIKEEEQRKDDFLKMVSHELKTPVTSIKGYTQLLLSIMKDQKDSTSAFFETPLLRIDKQVNRLSNLISEMLDLSRLDAGKLEMQKEHFSLDELVEETVQDIIFTNTGYSIIIKHTEQATVYADKNRIGQVIINLINNAIKYSPGKNLVEVIVSIQENNMAAVSVQDYGIGIEKADREKIFERFYQVGNSGENKFTGFGIGLFLANEIIQRHDGNIVVKSKKGKGSLFTFLLPIHTSLIKG